MLSTMDKHDINVMSQSITLVTDILTRTDYKGVYARRALGGYELGAPFIKQVKLLWQKKRK